MAWTCPHRVMWERRLSWAALGAAVVFFAGVMAGTDALTWIDRTDQWLDLRTGTPFGRRCEGLLVFNRALPVLTHWKTTALPEAGDTYCERYQALLRRLDAPPFEENAYLYRGFRSTSRAIPFGSEQQARHTGDEWVFTYFLWNVGEVSKETDGDEEDFVRKTRPMITRGLRPLVYAEPEKRPSGRTSSSFLQEQYDELKKRIMAR